MNRNYFKLPSFILISLLYLQLFAAPGLLRADDFTFDPEDSMVAFNGMEGFASEGGVRTTQSREVTISMEKETSGDKIDSAGEGGEEDLDLSFEDLEDPFADETPQYPAIQDPYEGYNRFMFNVNDTFYTYLLRPVAKGYKAVFPEPVRLSVKNLFQNARSPVNFVSSLVQGDFDKTGRVLGRLFINTTVGIGGLFDVAKTQFDIQPVNEDFDQALGYHGMEPGPYFVLPFLGPSSGRNFVGTVVDTLLNPVAMVSPSFVVGAGITAGQMTNETSFNYEAFDDLKDSAIDPYLSLRDFNHQYREGLIDK